MSTKKQPDWLDPATNNEETTYTSTNTLEVYNSLTRCKVNFTPKKEKHIKWYNCGPTVYDSAHIGHARVYVTVDYIRRILSEYFNYNILYVMNITDIDDKIILRARQNHLFNKLKESTDSLSQDLIDKVKTALNDFKKVRLGVDTNGVVNDQSKSDPKYLLYANSFRETVKAVVSAEFSFEDGDLSKKTAHQFLNESQDVISDWMDREHGASVTDSKIFRSSAAHWEQDFMEDMESLNVRPCDILTRVSEYVPEIITYVKKIVDNGYAYEADESVYFDTDLFDGKKDHHYAKLQPWSAGNEGLIEEGEGSLGVKLSGKKNKSDFALWKKSKPGEPSWNSPWGQGRPGWHIECSVMASEVLGDNMDIHSGGIDLAFPHHDNELAQSEAYHECKQWVNYFLHVGHLHIEGQKMSKSLKNFITIKQALKKYTSRQLRLCFLLHQWDSKLDFKDSVMTEAKTVDNTINNFFINVKALINEHKISMFESDGTHKYHDSEKELINFLYEKQLSIDEALCDSFNTPNAMNEILELINKTNVYLSSGRKKINMNVVETIAKFITKILRIFGLVENQSLDEIGFGSSSLVSSGQEKNTEDIILPYLRVLSSFRDNIRDLARQGKDHSEFLALSDKLRDNDLAELGVLLDDQEDGKALVKLVDPEGMFKDVKDENGEIAYSEFDEQFGFSISMKNLQCSFRVTPSMNLRYLHNYMTFRMKMHSKSDEDNSEISETTKVETSTAKLKKDWSSVQDINGNTSTFGTRILENKDDVYKHNAWDNVVWDEEQENHAKERIKKQSSQQMPLDDQTADYWNTFYQHNTNKFFKDRQWLKVEFPELFDVIESNAGNKKVFEIGCGAGNTLFPLSGLNKNPELFIYACDFSSTAIEVIKNSTEYNQEQSKAFVWDLTNQDIPEYIEPGSLDIVVLIFVMSAIRPQDWSQAVENIYKMLKPGGLVLFRDYGRYDMVQLRFKEGRMISDNFYVRGDGTRAYFFTSDRRLIVNRHRKLQMYRIWLQGKFRKR
nr:15961_t:CDS:10 [Entrophospora candida]